MIFVQRLAPVIVLALVGTATLALGGCKGSASLEPPPPPPFKARVLAVGDPGKPVMGAKISKGDKVLGTTALDGSADLTLNGADGEVVEAAVACPDGFKSPDKPLSIRISRTASAKVPTFSVTCAPSQRHVVVAVKAENGANLPIVYLGKVITHTDNSGAAHFALEAEPGQQFQVTIDTSGKEGDKLTPLSPSKPFTVGNGDDIFVFDQKFILPPKKVAKIRKPTIAKAL